MQSTLQNLPTDQLGGKQYFQSSEHSKVGMYATHPPNDLRQVNAKTPFIECKQDSRSPWDLFNDKESLQREATKLVYKTYFDKEPSSFVSDEEFEAFIQAESQGKELMESYANCFHDRFFFIPEDEFLERAARTTPLPSKESMDKLVEEVKPLMEPLKKIEDVLIQIQQIMEGVSKKKEVMYKGEVYFKKDLEAGFNTIMQERQELLDESFKDWDNRFSMSHFRIAHEVSKDDTLLKLYRQHRMLNSFFKSVLASQNAIMSKLHELQSQGYSGV